MITDYWANWSVNAIPGKFWTSKRIRITTVGPDGQNTIELNKPYALIGSHASADVVLRGNQIAKRHLFLIAIDDHIFRLDFPRGRKDRQRIGGWIAPGEPTEIGDYRLDVEFVGDPFSTQAPLPDPLSVESGEPPHPIIKISSKAARLGRQLLSRRLCLVGRSQCCALRLTTRSLSSEHCVLYRQGQHVWVMDLHSANQTRVEGSPVQCTRLSPDARIRLGRVFIDIEIPGDTRPDDDAGQFSGQQHESESADWSPVGSTAETTAEDRSNRLDDDPSRAELEREFTEITVSQDELSQSLDKQFHALEKVSMTLDQRERALDERHRALVEQEQQLDQRSHQIEAAHTDLEQQISTIHQQHNMLNDQITCLESERKEFDLAQGVRESHLAELLAKLDSREQTIASLRESLAEQSDQAEHQREELTAGYLKKIAKSEETIEKLKTEYDQQVASLQHQLEVLQGSVAEVNEIERQSALLAQQQSHLEEQRQAWLVDVQKRKRDVRDEENRLARLEQQSRSLAKELADQRQALEHDRDALKIERRQWDLQREQLEDKMRRRSEELAEQQQILAADREKIDAQREELGRFVAIDVAQRHFLTNLSQMRREKTILGRFLKWLKRPFRRF